MAKVRLAQLIWGNVIFVERDGRHDFYGHTLGTLRIGRALSQFRDVNGKRVAGHESGGEHFKLLGN